MMHDLHFRLEAEEELCGICLEVYQERVDTNCGHAFCRRCVEAVLSHGTRGACCPLCRKPLDPRSLRLHETGFALLPHTETATRTVTASVGCVWRYGDQFARGLGDYDVLTEDSWLVVDVCYYHVGAEARAVPPGTYLAAFRIKRLRTFRFLGQLVLYLEGVEHRRVVLANEVQQEGVWNLLVVGLIDVHVTRHVSASMRAFDQTASKRGLVIDCLVLYPPEQPPPSLIIKSNDSRPWTVVRAVRNDDGTYSDTGAFRRRIRLRHGRWIMEGLQCRLRRTKPISFVWPGTDVVYTNTMVIDNELVWHSDHPDTHAELRWIPRPISIFSDCRPSCSIS